MTVYGQSLQRGCSPGLGAVMKPEGRHLALGSEDLQETSPPSTADFQSRSPVPFLPRRESGQCGGRLEGRRNGRVAALCRELHFISRGPSLTCEVGSLTRARGREDGPGVRVALLPALLGGRRGPGRPTAGSQCLA